mmetsp:Transcript_11962/g.26439  ORF Transcript_11962/g.26439 Transcript_11962/m.26439 type:complete len:179 (-) Transcript_11962:178-714(-)|eukprot:CAMPEP_0204275546 /NCGR_PEP_ID=MMETSP0468-20130131/26216_1 /ASSEMBLY_ACC=CAM_ASM_000383 /TAXON_ID=2969 /ORGANISM="Oxyrrhis marina" /LENGTH=178 /DNA_ID=CAMNT_0051251911 /DNA_START=97 /DNA_END=633 /DNA_ORIENTATION=+
MGDDYLSSGGVKNLEILQGGGAPLLLQKPAEKKDDNLFLKGYGREWGGSMTYSVGMTYGLGMIAGSTWGLALGLRQGGATSKLLVNSCLNNVARHGSSLSNLGAINTMFFVGFKGLLGCFRDDDIFNTAGAAGMSGALYKAFDGPKVSARYALATCVVFTSLDQAMKIDSFTDPFARI